MFGGKTISAARYGVPGAILGVALAWFAGVRVPVAQAQQQTGPRGEPLLTYPQQMPRGDLGGGRGMPPQPAASGESSGTISLVVPSNNGASQWLYIIDTKTHAFAIYRVDTANPKEMVKLEAARQYQWDLKLDRYNNTGLVPADIEKLVKSLAQQVKQH